MLIMSRHHLALPTAALFLNVTISSLSWWPLRALESVGLHPLWCTAIIYLLPSLLICLFRPWALKVLWSNWSLWVLAISFGFTNSSYTWALTFGDVIRVVLLFYLMPLWAILFARLILREQTSAAGALQIAIGMVGAAIILWPDNGSWLPRSLPDWLGLAGGAAFAFSNVMMRREAHQPPAASALAIFFGTALVSAFLGLGLSASGNVSPPPPLGPWVIATVMLAICCLLSNLALQFGAARLPAKNTAVVMLSEIPIAAAAVWALGAGVLNESLAIGGTFIMVSALLTTIYENDAHHLKASAI